MTSPLERQRPLFRLNPGYFYRVGEAIHPLTEFSGQPTLANVFLRLHSAHERLLELLSFRILNTSIGDGNILLQILEGHLRQPFETQLSAGDTWGIANAATRFESVLKAELAVAPCYLVTPKGGYNVDILTLSAQAMFPPDLVSLVPESAYDVEQAGKCLAFEVPTATAFHLHRINEAVIHYYWDAITAGATRPKENSLGVYLTAIKKRKRGKNAAERKNVVAALTQIKNLHRNPVTHAEIALTPQEAIDLFGIIVSVISAMLSTIRAYKASTS